jgi:hypothetical protein
MRTIVDKKSIKKIAAKDADQYMLRLPPGLRDRVASRASDNGRSMNTEIVEAIEQHLTGADRVTQLWEIFTKHRENIEAIPFLLYAMDQLSLSVSRLSGENLHLMPSFREWREVREPEYAATLPLVTPAQAQTLRVLLKEIGIDEQVLIVHFPQVNRIEDIRGFERAKNVIEGIKANGIRALLKKNDTDEKRFLLTMGVNRIEDIRGFERAKNVIEGIKADEIRKFLKETNTDERNFLGFLRLARIEDGPGVELAKYIIKNLAASGYVAEAGGAPR